MIHSDFDRSSNKTAETNYTHARSILKSEQNMTLSSANVIGLLILMLPEALHVTGTN